MLILGTSEQIRSVGLAVTGGYVRVSIKKSREAYVLTTKKQFEIQVSWTSRHKIKIPQARFKRRGTAVPNEIDLIKFEVSTAVRRRWKPSRATAV